ncbi:polyribonucleotide nucleotidyltransferase [Bacillus mesophilus]|nr:polyribonucleotide nucleotidyltransferase [Bacillus mesophilus]
MGQEKQIFSTNWAGRPLTVEVGQFAKQASGAVMIRYGDTAVLSTATASKEPKDLSFFPLTVNYEERLYAVGKIPGGFIKREGRPSEKAILASRLIDRPIRPLFAEGFRNEVQVISIVMSVDQDCSSEMAAMFGSSLALSVSDIPFEGPIAGVTVGRVNDEFIINPSVELMEKSDIHLVVAGTKDAINMVEAGADEVPEEIMLEAIMFGHEEIKRLIEFQESIIAKVGKEKREVVLYQVDATIEQEVRELAEVKLNKAVQVFEKHAREDAINEVRKEVLAQYEAKEVEGSVLKQVSEVLYMLVKEEVRRLITQEKVRPDGRK